MDKTYDFVIAGGGSAAPSPPCGWSAISAFRCSSSSAARAAPRALMAMPAGYMKYLARDDFLEMHHTVPQPQLGGRGPIVPVAKALGGGSAVNAMVYMRGQKDDYDGWAAALGQPDRVVLRRHAAALQRRRGQLRASTTIITASAAICASPSPGTSPAPPRISCSPARALGHAYNPDFNGARQNGVGIMQHTYGHLGPLQGALGRQEGLPRSAGPATTASPSSPARASTRS